LTQPVIRLDYKTNKGQLVSFQAEHNTKWKKKITIKITEATRRIHRQSQLAWAEDLSSVHHSSNE